MKWSDYVVDLHTHALPQIDDGAQSVEESVCMLLDNIKQGVTTCVLTPHCHVINSQQIHDFIQKREKHFEMLTDHFRDSRIRLLLGGEVYLDRDISQYDGVEQLCITGTNYMLVELPYHNNPDSVSEWIYSLNLLNITVILAHIERYNNWREIMKSISELDVIFQLNSALFLSFMGRRLAKKILSQHTRFVVSSDMHNMDKRKSTMSKAFQIIQKKFSDNEMFMLTL
ncbi:MAG: hypothetical protein E7393_02750 [Ruminococcaceae bacterium]|nr:hypothetical protein [Oscillospiraceae bacterium]